jgi:homospermidine synthase
VAISALAAICWLITHKAKKGIFFPEDITDYKYILKLAEKYISKIIYKSFDKKTLSEALGVDLSKIRAKDFLVTSTTAAAAAATAGYASASE